MNTKTFYVVRLDSFEGEDTYLRCGDDVQDHLFCIIVVTPEGAEVVDSAYRSIAEAKAAWPEARG